MSDQFVAEIRIFACNFAPVGWAMCNGQLLPISQNTALFSLIGTFYGGNGTSNFALPNLQGAAPMAQGNGFGLSPRVVGEAGGETSVTLYQAQLPAHTHAFNTYAGRGINQTAPGSGLTLSESQGQSVYDATQNPALTQMNPSMVGVTGGGGAHNNLMPYLALNFCIALQGIYPPRS
jgi:microcystin-dependent protein